MKELNRQYHENGKLIRENTNLKKHNDELITTVREYKAKKDKQVFELQLQLNIITGKEKVNLINHEYKKKDNEAIKSILIAKNHELFQQKMKIK